MRNSSTTQIKRVYEFYRKRIWKANILFLFQRSYKIVPKISRYLPRSHCTLLETIVAMTKSPSHSSSEAVDITPERKDAFREFLLTLPRKCSPTICGIIAEQKDDEPINKVSISEISMMDISTCSAATSAPNVSADISVKENANTTTRCIWSIDEYSQLYGTDFDNVHELEHFHNYESEHLSEHFTCESDIFFSQDSIIPSPITRNAALSVAGSDGDVESKSGVSSENGFFSRSTGSFLRYIDSLNGNNNNNNNTLTMNDDNDDDDDDRSRNDQQSLPQSTEAVTSAQPPPLSPLKADQQPIEIKTPTKRKTKPQTRLSFSDSDFVSMDISSVVSTTPGVKATAAACTHQSSDLQSKFNRYFDFSPISPISKRPVFAGNLNAISANRLPMSSFGVHLTSDDFRNISPIAPFCAVDKQSRLADIASSAATATTTKTISTQIDDCAQQPIVSDRKPNYNTDQTTPLKSQSPMSMSVDDISGFVSLNPPSSANNDDDALATATANECDTHFGDDKKSPNFCDCNEAIFKTPQSKPARTRATNRRTKLIFAECTSTPN